MSKILDDFNDINSVKKMSIQELNVFAGEIRSFLIEKVSKTGGHLASNLGVVELTLSLYNVFNLDKDKLIWDVGHQSYVHKILTGRKDKFDALRNFGGLSGFPKKEESKYDIFESGHSSTSISAGLGIARARDLQKEDYNVISVIGDGALTGGMSFEALNDIGFRKTKMIIVLNDNQMSISKNVGGMSKYLSQFRIDPTYNRIKKEINSTLRKIPSVGDGMVSSIQKIKNGIKQVIVPGMLFEHMGIKYLGPIDGHDIKEVSKVLKLAKEIDGPVIIHVITKKGKGYKFAENQPRKYHSVGPFNPLIGELCGSSKKSYSDGFGEQIVSLAKENKNIVAITAAMPEGTGLEMFSKQFPNRFFDVGIAEQHAVTMAAGMASQGLKPIFAVYSTFLQRAYDQIVHDVCIQKLPVIFAIDRAGIVGADGETHQGVFDLSYLSHIPNMTIMAPKCISELKSMLTFAVKQDYPIAIRYPRGGDNCNVKMSPIENFKRGKWETLLGGGKIAFIATGKMVQNAILVREKLNNMGIEATVINACFIKPIDKELLLELVNKKYSLVTIEDNLVHGGLGSLVLEYVNSLTTKTRVINLGFKDEFIPHGTVDILYKLHKLDVDGIFESILGLV
ncbi:1-deoxy-D-xylulose-5-phosphate synthase [Clostridium sp. CM028]|uniref:1-deoxy-D-xylulose-5-phosphate synthase n=1 Tax=unclassified Clostridium TaxID=2614128 RepID=UPI001C0B27AE|nr:MULTISPECIES: 1-deoxy-D-xylulose-5-phosphate synthase [unclassified Clostridium]MBU3091559.1 1-deoxy-D-xylulose-5-phosphate synthase [Clostridium sp. CF011]MBW9144177.1 1-deoxy-D-xylulose-5-phosphate synthase [Clostridium sp. CM027]MBW9147513.1 1-deoxy-D-xylulose-5-phosphate synthase [Clostridium sp. CM028]UVE41180.1 1-deoxy-D-xylulose-5-phosphate synthase [Clostridium sp. CM027]WAG70176.1 1-deoxy-D-xylulose-5-phosphate synthase [Clostridium sp. CF011]